MEEQEIWKPCRGYEKYIEVSTYGRIRTVDREYINSLGRRVYVKSRISKTYTIKGGYKVATIILYDKGIGVSKKELVHRLVASTFIPNPDNLPQVNHRDECKTNNFVGNLEWCTHQYNMNYGTRRMREAKTKSKPIYQISLKGEILKKWDSLSEASKNLGINIANISAVCRGVKSNYTAGGFKWAFV